MKPILSSMRSAVAKRILVLFVFCALLPTGSLALYSLWQLHGNLLRENEQQLRQATKNVGMSILEGLLLLEDEIQFLASTYPSDGGGFPRGELLQPDGSRSRRYKSLTWVRGEAERVPLFGGPPVLPPIPASVRAHLASGKSAVLTEPGPAGSIRMFMVAAGRGAGRRKEILIGELTPQFLWDLALRSVPPDITVDLLGPGGTRIFSNRPGTGNPAGRIETEKEGAPSGLFEWEDGDDPSLVSYWSVFLKPTFHSEDWVVATSRPRAAVFAPVGQFSWAFVGILLLALLVASFLSVGQIRRSLIPLAELREGTRNISRGDFESRVSIRSGDEFEELADSFNVMTERLQREFRALTETGDIVRAILTALDRERIAEAVLMKLRNLVPCDLVALSLASPDGSDSAQIFRLRFPSGDRRKPETIGTRLLPEEVERLRGISECISVDSAETFPCLLSPLTGEGVRTFVLYPILDDGSFTGVLILGYGDRSARGREDDLRVRPIADQVAVALANSRLLEELSRQNWGVMNALARAVDAKSPWTAGHSERVAQLSGRIGQAMTLSAEMQKTLHQGALLHDIGKIGVPGDILEKQEDLTDAEWHCMKEHPEQGARILDPIPAFREIIPVVSQHHERFDGQGYPRGISGEAISLNARIVAVADVFDALVSNRPYRSAWSWEGVCSFIRRNAGTLFDPTVVRAFEEVIRRDFSEPGFEEEYRRAGPRPVFPERSPVPFPNA